MAVRRSERLRTAAQKSSFLDSLACDEQCSACLLEIVGEDEDGESFAILDCCQPHHVFHIGCIFTWAEQENTCPQCKMRFAEIGIYGADGTLRRIRRVEERDQCFSEEEEGPEEDSVCEVCEKSTDEAAMLLCDGAGGTCNAAYHYYCVGLKAVPEGEWFCPSCTADKSASTACSSTSEPQQAPSSVVVKRERQESDDEAQQSENPSQSQVVVKKELSDADFERLWSQADAVSQQADAVSQQAAQGSSPPEASPISAQLVKTEPREVSLPPVKSEPKQTSPSKRSKKHPGSTSSPDLHPYCKQMPKWISRQGSIIKIDLGGRDIRDTAAKILGQVVQAAIAHIFQGIANDGFAVSMLLAGNQLHRKGIESLLQGVANAGARVSRLHLERNRLDDNATNWLAQWCEKQPGGPPDELYLNGNRISDKGASHLLQVLSRSSRQRAVPLWIELGRNRIRDAAAMLDQLSEEVEVCLAVDRSACGPSRCTASEDDCGDLTLPSLHLYSIMEQSIDEPDEMPPQPKRIKSEPSQDSAASDMHIKKQEVRNSVKLEMPAAQPASPRLVASGVFGPTVTTETAASSSSTAISSTQGGDAPPERGRGRGRDRGRGRGRGRSSSASVAALCAAAESDAIAPEDMSAEQAAFLKKAEEAKARHSWASTLGAQRKPGSFNIDIDTRILPDAPPSFGLWDLCKPKARTQKRKQANPGVLVATAPAAAPVAPLQQSSGSAVAATPVVAPLAPPQQSSRVDQTTTLVPLPAAGSDACPVADVNLDAGSSTALVAAEKGSEGKDSSKELRGGSNVQKSKTNNKFPNPTLLNLITQEINKEKHLWHGMHREEVSLRRRCLANQLCKSAQENHFATMCADAGSWETAVRIQSCQKRILHWIRKKIGETLAKPKRK